MYLYEPLAKAADEMAGLVRAVRPWHSSATTPCDDYDLHGLVNHLLYWAPVIESAGRREPIAPDRPAEHDADYAAGDWQAGYLAHLERLPQAWRAAEAWEGTTSVGVAELPAERVGALALCELVLHGWDLARATGQQYRCEAEVAETIRDVVAERAEKSRAIGVYGPEVAVPTTASAFERALACSGRSPSWPD